MILHLYVTLAHFLCLAKLAGVVLCQGHFDILLDTFAVLRGRCLSCRLLLDGVSLLYNNRAHVGAASLVSHRDVALLEFRAAGEGMVAVALIKPVGAVRSRPALTTVVDFEVLAQCSLPSLVSNGHRCLRVMNCSSIVENSSEGVLLSLGETFFELINGRIVRNESRRRLLKFALKEINAFNFLTDGGIFLSAFIL